MNLSHFHHSGFPFSYDRQLLLADIIGDLPWLYDREIGILCFGDRFCFQAEVLGTESEETRSWLWAWANVASNIPAKAQGASLKLKALGEKHGLAELTDPSVPLQHVDGHVLASIAVGLGLGKAYYRATYEGGAAFLLITDERLQFDVEDPLRRIVAVFPRVILAIELPDHRQALRGYLEHYGFQAAFDGDVLLVGQQGQELLRAEFDDLGRLRELKANFGQSGKL